MNQPDIRLQPDGLFSYTAANGVHHPNLSDDELVRLRVKDLRAGLVREARSLVLQLRAADHDEHDTAPKCRGCGSQKNEVARSMLGVSGPCGDDFHLPRAQSAQSA